MAKIYTQYVAFADCDPAGIVYYPNMLSWMDQAFHRHLDPLGGHDAICKELGSVGIGLATVTARFARPLRPSDLIDIHIKDIQWGQKSLTLSYFGAIGDQIYFSGEETRCIFIAAPQGFTAGEVAPLRQRMEPDNAS